MANVGFSLSAGGHADVVRDAALVAACEAARAAVQAFTEGARRGDPFDKLCELSEREHRAVKAATAIRSTSATGIAEKARLLDCVTNAAARFESSPETVDVALSLAADAVALAKAMSGAAKPRA